MDYIREAEKVPYHYRDLKYALDNLRHQWTEKVKCPACGQECWLPGGVTAEMVAKYGARCSKCVWGKKLTF